MSQSPHLALTLLVSNQAQKEITANEALVRLEALPLFVLDENTFYRFDGTSWVRTDSARTRGSIQLSSRGSCEQFSGE